MKRGNVYRAGVRAADVVFIYATPRELARLQARLADQLRSGARVVTIGSDFAGWEANKTDREKLVFAYAMPPAWARNASR